MRTHHWFLIIPLLALMLWPGGPGHAMVLQRVSVSATGEEANGPSERPSLSRDGNLVVFTSKADNLVPGDTNGLGDVFIYDRSAGTITCASRALDGGPANNASRNAVISADGKYVAFESDASNLVLHDTNGVSDVFIYSLETQRTERISVSRTGGDPDGPSFTPTISGDGTYVAFASRATNLLATPPSDNPAVADIFIRDRLNGVTLWASRSSGGIAPNGDCLHPAISSDGRTVAFESTATNLALRDYNGVSDVFLHDRLTQETIPVSGNLLGLTGNGASFSPALSGDGRYVVFASFASDLVSGSLINLAYSNIIVLDRIGGRMSSITMGGDYFTLGYSRNPVISEDGTLIAFCSDAATIEAGDSNGVADIFVNDRRYGVSQPTTLISTGPAPLGTAALDPATMPAISGDGSVVAFQCATPLIPEDRNGVTDIFLSDTHEGPPQQPTDLEVVQSAENQATLTWRDRSSNEDYFELEYRMDDDLWWLPVAYLPPNAVSLVVSNLWDGHLYTFRVRAGNYDEGTETYYTSGYTNEASIWPTGGWQYEAVNWQVEYGNNWNTNGWVIKPGATNLMLYFYQIQTEEGRDYLRSDAGDSWSGDYHGVYSTSRPGQTVTLTLSSNAFNKGSFTIAAVLFRGNATGPATVGGPLFEGATTNPGIGLPPPTELTATVVDAAIVDLNWVDNCANEMGYEVQRRTLEGAFATIAHLPANTTQYQDASCPGGEPVIYRVRATGLVGVSEWSNEARAMTYLGGYGELQTIGEGVDTVNVLYTGGTPYQIGYWHGMLLHDDVVASIDYALQVTQNEIPLEGLLAIWRMMEPYVSPELMLEMQGLSDASGVPLDLIHAMHALPDAAEFHCSAFAAFGPATANGHMIQLRNLDFSMDLGIQDHPLVVIAEPLNGVKYANVTFAGFIGSIAGMNAAGVGVSEVGESYDYAYEKLDGTPMPFVLRNVIAHATSLNDAIAIIEGAEPTSSYVFVVGDARTPDAAVFMYSPSIFQYWGPGGVATIDREPGLPNIVYHGMYNDRLYADLAAATGTITPEVTMAISEHNAMINSNLMNTIYDLTTGDLWVNYAEGPTGRAANQPFVYLNILAHQTPPLTITVTPAPGTVGSPASQVVARFSKAIDPASLEGALQVAGAAPVSGTIAYNPEALTATFTPATLLSPGTYTVTIKGGPQGLRGANGLTMPEDFVSSFQIADQQAPMLSFVTPQQGAKVRGMATLEVQASDPDGRVARVEIFIDDRLTALTSPPCRLRWDTVPLSVAEGQHLIRARAYDTAGHCTERQITVLVDNTTFDDVLKTNGQWAYVEAIAREGIASGCSRVPPLYCPNSTLTRGQMAVLLCRAAGLAPYANPVPSFVDVPAGDARYGYVEALVRAGITTGCSQQPPRYCPEAPITRGQMAVFLCRAASRAPVYPAQPTFGDVPSSNPQYGYIEALVAAGVTSGCSSKPPAFCPNAAVTRGQMAVFLCRDFGISTAQ